MKTKQTVLYYSIQLVFLFIFLLLTIGNEIFELPCRIFKVDHAAFLYRFGEMLIEIIIFSTIAIFQLFVTRFYLKKIKNYERQEEILEHAFFHDILNTAGALNAFAQILQMENAETFDEYDRYKSLVSLTSKQLIEEIEFQRDYKNARENNLLIDSQKINIDELLQEIVAIYQNHPLAKNKQLSYAAFHENESFISNKKLLKRVLCNMLKNAFEASKEGETVTLRCEIKDKEIEFEVHNPGFISPDIQSQIFQLLFSTKGKGRGIGTHSIKLLSEQYLKGKICFTTSVENGTTFKAVYPLSCQ